MIKALIVEDETLVRKGIISILPWNRYNIKVVGEASNGREALDFIESHDVDLLITDLAMPVMSGFELIKLVHEKFPRTFIVILTCYQDFDYIQEAMRQGAIDYIVKTELELDKMEAVLKRINGRIAQIVSSKSIIKAENIGNKCGILLCTTNTTEFISISQLNLLSRDAQALSIGKGTWFIPYLTEESMHEFEDRFIKSNMENCIIIKICNICGTNIDKMCEWLIEFEYSTLFYEFSPEKRIYTISMEVPVGKPAKSIKSWLVEKWASLCWVYDQELFKELIHYLNEVKLPYSKLKDLFYEALLEWNRILVPGKYLKDWMNRIHEMTFWYYWIEWFKEVTETIKESIGAGGYSEEIILSILKALQYMHRQPVLAFTEKEVAETVNVSRGYFSKCFKDITGKSFIEYKRDLWIEKSKQLLIRTNLPIYLIAEQVGFTDERYFSRTFSCVTGMLPSQYRKAKGVKNV